MMMIASDEFIASAKASKILADMRNMKTALNAWYLDNLGRVVKKGNGEYQIYLNSNKTGGTEYLGEFLKKRKSEITKYLNGADIVELQAHNDTTNWSKNHSTGCYFLCSETVGERSNSQKDDVTYESKNINGIQLKGTSWYVGYCFGKSEGNLKKKLRLKLKHWNLSEVSKK